jgi:hypothetical protein
MNEKPRKENTMQAISMIGELLRFNAGYLHKMVSELPTEAWYVKPANRCNPIIWIYGHIIVNRGEIIEVLGGDPNNGNLPDLFARGTHPAADRSVYPEPLKLASRLNKMMLLTDQLIKSCNPDILDNPSWGNFESVGQNLAFSYMHETHHIGQISYIRTLPEVKSAEQKKASSQKKNIAFDKHINGKNNTTTKIILDNIKSVFS